MNTEKKHKNGFVVPTGSRSFTQELIELGGKGLIQSLREDAASHYVDVIRQGGQIGLIGELALSSVGLSEGRVREMLLREEIK